MLHRLNDVLEAQAKRIAAQLHDESAQLLATVHFALAEVASQLPAERAVGIQEARGLLDQIEQRLRTLAHELRPPILDDLGLVPALEFLADTVSKRWGLAVTVQVSLCRDLPATVEAILYRIAQRGAHQRGQARESAQAQGHRHAGPRTASPARFATTVSGMDATVLAPGSGGRGLGLVEIQERVAALGGVLRLGANTPRGTDLTVEIPLES